MIAFIGLSFLYLRLHTSIIVYHVPWTWSLYDLILEKNILWPINHHLLYFHFFLCSCQLSKFHLSSYSRRIYNRNIIYLQSKHLLQLINNSLKNSKAQPISSRYLCTFTFIAHFIISFRYFIRVWVYEVMVA